jgi:hypothetical protein
MNKSTDQKYRTYLLRIWRAETPHCGWRASLQDPHTEQRIGFATLEQLFTFLMEQAEKDIQFTKEKKL